MFLVLWPTFDSFAHFWIFLEITFYLMISRYLFSGLIFLLCTDWHACVNCRKSPDYYCLCCPNYSVCHNCLGRVKFFKLGKENKGLCVLCFALAISIEKKAADPRVTACIYPTLVLKSWYLVSIRQLGLFVFFLCTIYLFSSSTEFELDFFVKIMPSSLHRKLI